MTTTLAFDIYGTLLDTSSIAVALSKHLLLDEEKAVSISSLWRRYQLEYTWRLNSMEIYVSFDDVTQQSLVHALKESGVTGYSDEQIQSIMREYHTLPCFHETVQVLRELQSNREINIAVFSNGTQAMVQQALAAANISDLATNIYVADEVRVYKPAVKIYQGLLAKLGLESNPSQCWLISGNPFDVTGALNAGMRAIWVDRKGTGWVDSCFSFPDQSQSEKSAREPTLIVNNLEGILNHFRS